MSKRKATNTRASAYSSIDRYRPAHFAICTVAALFAAASVAGTLLIVNGMGFAGYMLIGALTLAGALVFTIDMVSVLVAPAFARAKGWAKASGFGLVVLVMVIGAGFQTLAANTFAGQYTAGTVQTAQARVTAVQAKLDALPSMQSVCEGFGPQNCAARQTGLQADRDALAGELSTAKAEATQAASHGLSLTALGLMLMGFQIAMFFLRTWLTGVTDRQIADAKAERAKERAKAKRRKPEPKPKATPERKLKLVAAND